MSVTPSLRSPRLAETAMRARTSRPWLGDESIHVEHPRRRAPGIPPAAQRRRSHRMVADLIADVIVDEVAGRRRRALPCLENACANSSRTESSNPPFPILPMKGRGKAHPAAKANQTEIQATR